MVEKDLIERFETLEWEAHNARWGVEEYMQQLDQRFPNKEERVSYTLWVAERSRQDRITERTSPLSRNEVVQMLDTMNYNDSLSQSRIISVMSCQIAPWLPVGKDEYGDFYRISLDPYALLPDEKDPPNEQPLESENILGVNINVQPPGLYPRVSCLPEKCTVVNESDDSWIRVPSNWFLEKWRGRKESLQTLDDAGKGRWTRSQFAAVMRIDRNGTSNGVYIFFAFYDLDQCAGTRFPKIQGDNWGDLGKRKERFSCAKIANKLSELELFRPFQLTEVVGHAVEIVRAVISQGTLIRATTA